MDPRSIICEAGRWQPSTEMSACSEGLCSINTFGGLWTSTGYLGFKRNTSSVSGSTPRSVPANDLRLDVRLKKEIVTVQSMGHGGPEMHRLATKKQLEHKGVAPSGRASLPQSVTKNAEAHQRAVTQCITLNRWDAFEG